MNITHIEVCLIGLIALVTTALTAWGRLGWWINSRLVRHSYVLGSCLVAFVACSVPRMALCADDGAELRTDEATNDSPAVHLEDPRRALPRRPEPPALTADGVADVAPVAGAAPEPQSHADVDPRLALPRPPVPELTSNGLADDPVPVPRADPRAALPRPPIPSRESIAAAEDVPPVDVEWAGVEPEIAVLDSAAAEILAAADIEAEASHIPEESEEVGSDKDAVVTSREPQLDVAAMIPSQTSGPVRLADGEGYRVVAGPYYSAGGGNRELDDEMIRAVTTYVERHVGQSGVADRLGFDVDYVRRNLLLGEAVEEVKRETYPPTRYMTAVLKFDQEFLGDLDSRWTSAVRGARLRQVSFGTGGVLALLATVFGYLRLDTATRGSYTGRLQLVATGAILALAGLGVLLARWIPWI